MHRSRSRAIDLKNLREATVLVLGWMFIGIARAATIAAPQVALVTYGPGRVYWERFGHDAIIINDPAVGEPIVYNYGVFDFQQKNFFLDFVRGRMHYSLIAEPFDTDVATFAAEGRSVTVQILNLEPAQARWLAKFLAWNAQPQNAGYRYDYFINNCSTKVRDALNRALGGALERQLAARPAPHTYRFDAVRLISPDFWLALGMDVGLGPRADHPLNLWQESFVPMVLSRALRGVVVRDAFGKTRPLVTDEQVLLAGKLPPAPAAPRALLLPFLIAGLALAGLLLWLALAESRLHGTCFAILACAWWLACGLSGTLLAGFWAFTDHWPAWGNENLLLLDPLCLALPFVWRSAPRIARFLAILIAVAALMSLVIRALPGLYEHNLAYVALAIPVHAALAMIAAARATPAVPARAPDARRTGAEPSV